MSDQNAALSVGDILAGLKELRSQSDDAERSANAWRLLTRAYGNPEAGAVLDFAQEHGLVRSCADYEGGTDGGPRHSFLWKNPIDRSEMVWIPAGPFIVGKDKEQRRLTCPGFSMARHPVTNHQFWRFLDATKFKPPECQDERFLAHWQESEVFPGGLDDHPVVRVSFLFALAYCRWAGLALPTEWLWEKAARGTDGRSYPWGEEPPVSSTGTLANVRSSETRPVGSFPRTRTAYGCEDMIGNVSEWCRIVEGRDLGRIPDDWPYVSDALAGKTVYAALRGSAYLRRNMGRMIAAHQRILGMTRRNHWVGFRPACLLPCMPAR
jgi:serine/threonine-protein kinase